MHITAQGPPSQGDERGTIKYEWDVKLYYTIPYYLHARVYSSFGQRCTVKSHSSIFVLGYFVRDP